MSDDVVGVGRVFLPRDQRVVLSCRRAVSGLVLLSAVISAGTLLAWLFASDEHRPAAAVLALRPNTAVALLLLTAALHLLCSAAGLGSARLVGVSAGLGGLIGSATLGEYLTGGDWGIDQILIRVGIVDLGGPAPPRMAPATALALTLLGAGMLALLGGRCPGRVAWVYAGQVLALVALAVVLIRLYGLVYSIPQLERFDVSYAAMAPQTAAALMCLAMGVFFVRADAGLAGLLTADTATALFARLTFGAAFLISPGLGWLRLTGERAGLYGTEVGIALLVTGDVIVLAGVCLGASAVAGRVERARLVAEVAGERHRHLQTLLDHSPAAMFVKDIEGRYLAVNERFVRMFAPGRPALVGLTADEVFDAETAERIRRNDREVIRAERPMQFEVVLGVDGTKRHFLTESFPLPQGTGASAICGICTDITPRVAAERERERLNRRFQMLVEAAPDAMIIADVQGRIVLVNHAAARMFGYAREELIGQKVEILVPGPLRQRHAAHRRSYAGAPLAHQMGEDLDLVGLSKSGHQIPVEISLGPIDLDDGYLVCAVVRDASDRRRREQRRLLALELSSQLSASLDVQVLAGTLAQALVPQLADLALIDLVERDPAGAAVLLRRVAQASAPCLGRLTASPAAVLKATGDHPAWLACLTGQPTTLPELTETALTRLGLAEPLPAVLSAGEANGETALGIVVPLRAHGKVPAVLTLLRCGHPQPYSPEDVDWLVAVADRAALTITTALMYAEQQHVALTLQRALMGSPADLEGLEAAYRYLPAGQERGVGGDWFDVVDLGEGRAGLLVGDVMGRGLEAATVMGRLRSAANALARTGMSPGELMTVLDTLVADLPDQFVTCAYLVLDPRLGQLRLCSAGHLPVLLVEPDATVRWEAASPDLPLGVGGRPYRHLTLPLPPGATLVLYTDGLIETRQADIESRISFLAGTLHQASDVLPDLERTADHILASALAHVRSPEDDVTLLLARPKDAGMTQVAAIELPARPEAVATGRHFCSSTLRTWQCTDIDDTARLLASELLTNAVRHAAGPIRLRLYRTPEQLTIEVTDHTAALPRRADAGNLDETGRGLLLIDTLATHWGCWRTQDGGKTVWLTLAGSAPG